MQGNTLVGKPPIAKTHEELVVHIPFDLYLKLKAKAERLRVFPNVLVLKAIERDLRPR